MPRYSHAYTIAFEVISDHPDGEDVTPEKFRAGLLARIRKADIMEEWPYIHVDNPFDTHKIGED